ncbi:MAG: GtrA family protein [Lachnospiraceae bacterium]|nr:GtrA family protein [Lachnospiraceae bacterium]
MIRKLMEKYRDVIPYLVFGILTTIVNIVAYWLCAHPLHLGIMVSTVIAWVLSVLFAYVTNRKWVFHSEAAGVAIIREILSFYGARLATGLLDMLFMFIFADRLGLNDTVIKICSNVVVVILNYIFSKFLIFRHEEKGSDEK